MGFDLCDDCYRAGRHLSGRFSQQHTSGGCSCSARTWADAGLTLRDAGWLLACADACFISVATDHVMRERPLRKTFMHIMRSRHPSLSAQDLLALIRLAVVPEDADDGVGDIADDLAMHLAQVSAARPLLATRFVLVRRHGH